MSGPPAAVDPLRLRFRRLHRHRPWGLLSPFVAHDRTDVGPLPPGLTELGPGPRAPFCAVVADVAEATGGLRIGLTGDGLGVLVTADPVRGTVAIEVTGPGGSDVLPASARLRGRFGLAVVVNADHVTALVRPDGGQWRPLRTESDRVRAVLDLRDPAVLRRLSYAYGGTGDGAVRLTRLRAGISGPAGVRDPQVVRRADGSPLVRDGRVWLTLTSAGFGHRGRSHWGVWTLDLADPSRLEQVGALFSARDGLVLGDLAGQLVVDEDAGRTTVVVSTWGDFTPQAGVHLRHTTTDADLLSGVHVLETERLDVPTPHSAWDPSLARIDGRWHLAFVECVSFGPPRFVFHPVLAATDGPEFPGRLVRIAADETREQTEGTILSRFGNRWYVLASDKDARRYRLYDLSLRPVGSLRAPYLSNIPHPMLVPTGAAPDAPWWLLTFDGTPWHRDVFGYGTHGDFVVLEGREAADGALRRLGDAVRYRLPVRR